MPGTYSGGGRERRLRQGRFDRHPGAAPLQIATQVHWGEFRPQSRPPARQVPDLPEKL